jgi:hypothetical protein
MFTPVPVVEVVRDEGAATKHVEGSGRVPALAGQVGALVD